MPLTFEILSGGNITLSKVENQGYAYDISFNYQVNNGAWTRFDAEYDNPPSIPVSGGDEVRIVADTNWTHFSMSSGAYWTFGTSTARFDIKGNILSLITPQYATTTAFADTRASGNSYTFYKLFASCTTINSAEHLILPVDTLEACYNEMFSRSTIFIIPALPASDVKTLAYRHMFSYCSGLTSVPKDLFAALSGATLPTKAMSSMFRNTRIVSAPDLPATTIGTDCYGAMFRDNPALVIGPVLPALTVPDYAYQYMFYGCSVLDTVTCLATSLGINSTTSWLSGVAPTGTFVKNPNMSSWTGIPSGWTVVDASL